MTGAAALVRLALRRDRVMLPVWTVLFVLLASATASSTSNLYPTVHDRIQLASSSNDTPALVALYGRVYDPTSLGAVSMLKLNVFGAIMAAILSIVIVVRHTRGDEESGRLELIGATAVGRRAPLTAAVLVVVAANVVIAVVCALGLTAAGLDGAGSLAAGLAWGGVGICFGAIAAVIAQLTQSARAATGMSSAALGGFYVIRALGDTAPADGVRWLSWLSPVGWGQQFRPYAGNRWWVGLIMVGFAALVFAAAYALVARRDLGAGLLPDRPGPATAPASLAGPLGLAWRLQRGSVIAWGAAFLIGGVLFGSMADNVGSMLDSASARDFIQRLGGTKGLTDAFLSTELGVVGVLAAVFAVQATMRLRAEEAGQRAEPVLATATSRLRWAGGHLAIALAGSAVMLAVVGLGAGLTYGSATGDAGQIGRLLAAALVQVPAVWAMTAIVVLVYGFWPRLTVAGWGILIAFLLVGEFGPVFKLPQAVMDVSPFAHTPRLPGNDVSAAPLIWLLLVAVCLGGAGLYGLRRRDMALG